jgi:hypothetical protein
VPTQSPESTVEKLKVCTQTILRDADNLAVWVYFDRNVDSVSHSEKVSLLNTEIQSICNEHSSTLDESLIRKNPRPNPTPRVFIEQGNDLSRVLWLRWEP